MTIPNKAFFQSAAIFSLTATCLVLPLSTSLLSLFSLITLFLWLFCGKWQALLTLLRTNAIVLLVILLLILFLVGLSYTSADISDALSYLKKYRKLLFIPVVMSLLQGNPTAKIRCETAFLVGCVILLATSYCMYFSIIPSPKFGNSLLFHITHSFFISILAFYAAQKAVDSLHIKVKSLWILLFLLCFLNMFYLTPGRTGMFIFPFLMLLFFMQRLSIVKQLLCLVLLVSILWVAFTTSQNFNSRSMAAVQEIQSYEYGASRTSLGMRFDWWRDSIALMKESPVFGHGTGSFAAAHDTFIRGSELMKTDNPHNEFLLIGVQLGLAGLAVFILLLLAQFLCSLKLEKPDKLYVQGILVAIIVGCTMNSFLLDTHQGHLWAILSAVYLSSTPSFMVTST